MPCAELGDALFELASWLNEDAWPRARLDCVSWWWVLGVLHLVSRAVLLLSM